MYLSALPHFFGRSINPYTIHQMAWEAFPGRPSGSTAPFQFSIQETDKQIYVRSVEAPTWPIEGVRVKQERDVYTVGSTLEVEVLINPIRRCTKKGHTKETLISGSKSAAEYARVLLEENGLLVLENFLSDDSDETGYQIHAVPLSGLPIQKTDGSQIPLVLYRVTALVLVQGESAFTEALQHGIGRKKSFGAGMILVRTVVG